MKEPVYEVFARKNREDPLHHVGCLNAADPDLARVYAWKMYDEQNWLEMYVVARQNLLPVNRTQRSAPLPPPRPIASGTGAYGGDDVAAEGGAG